MTPASFCSFDLYRLLLLHRASFSWSFLSPAYSHPQWDCNTWQVNLSLLLVEACVEWRRWGAAGRPVCCLPLHHGEGAHQRRTILYSKGLPSAPEDHQRLGNHCQALQHHPPVFVKWGHGNREVLDELLCLVKVADRKVVNRRANKK